jgi:hypothetical protein
MESMEKQKMLALLERGRAALLASLEGVSDEMAARSPGEGRWSIVGCVEHLGVSEDYLFSQIVAATPSQTPLTNEKREAKMLAFGADRSRRIESPPEGHPKATFRTLPEAVGHFLASRKRTVEFVETNREDLRAKVTWHPILETANCHEMLLSIGVHCLRHVNQIQEIKAELGCAGKI